MCQRRNFVSLEEGGLELWQLVTVVSAAAADTTPDESAARFCDGLLDVMVRALNAAHVARRDGTSHGVMA